MAFLSRSRAYFQSSNFAGVIWQVSVRLALSADHFGSANTGRFLHALEDLRRYGLPKTKGALTWGLAPAHLLQVFGIAVAFHGDLC